MIGFLKPKPAAYKVADVKGLFLLVTPTGGKLWRLKFRNSVGVEGNAPLAPIPAPRWTAFDEARFKEKMPANVLMSHQERACTSPNWSSPA